MAADQAPRQAGKTRAAITGLARAVTRPGGKDVDWDKVRVVGTIIGAVAVIPALKTRSWRYVHTAAAALAIWAAAAGRLKDRYARPAEAPEHK